MCIEFKFEIVQIELYISYIDDSDGIIYMCVVD